MPQLIKNGKLTDPDGIEFVSLEAWQADSGEALLLQVDDEPDAKMAGAPAIAIHFGAFNDGRGLSLAVLLRSRHGFEGDLRAVGDVHHDLVHYLVRCGFTSYELPEGRDVTVALRGAEVYSRYYQASVAESRQDALKRVA
jgi:uncharacterized protein (DUF934 family)